ncbi:MAG: hypothetical protein E7548_01185 [Ruminococcaceae bacterium]|nr:hypothetical protein [Oscillospiraceae bacterium]
MKAIGIDLGTTSVCGAVIDVNTGEVLKSRTESSNAFVCSDKAYEKIQDPKKIICLALEILNSLIDGEVASIGVTGQMHGIVYFDKEGAAVSPLYTWQDGRGNELYKNTTYAKHLGSFSGYGNVTDFYNRENGLVPKTAVGYCTIHDYLVMKLCGLKRPIIHSSDAASLGLYDITKNVFNYPFSDEITTDYRIAGTYKGIRVSVAIGDNQASVFSTLKDENDLLINVGTGSQVSIISDKVVSGENLETRPYFENKFLIVGAALCGGRAYSMLKNFYKEVLCFTKDFSDEKIYEIMGKMIEKAKSTTLSVDTRFAGTRKNPALCGSIRNITTENFNCGELTRATLCGMSTELYDLYSEMGQRRSGLVASGNGIRKNPYFVKILSEKFGAQVKIPTHLEEAAVGAALFSLISAGIFKNEAEAKRCIRYS